MQENDKPVLIYSTFPDAGTAEKVGRNLVSQNLCACVNILPDMTSIYRWQGAVETAREVVMIIKTRAELTDAIFAAVETGHPYQTPALLVLTIDGGSADYLAWIVTNSVKDGPKDG